MNASRANLITSGILIFYYLWWAYLAFVFNQKAYDNNYAGAVATEFVVLVTCLMIGVSVMLFLVLAFATKKWLKYIVFTLFLFLPLFMVYLFSKPPELPA